jgi:UDP-N-acetylglucosamine 1-carboxyvinyltransferase
MNNAKAEKIVMEGGYPLHGKIYVSGSKNACLALMPCSLLTEETVCLTNTPRLIDIDTMIELFTSLGVSVEQTQGQINICSANCKKTLASYEIVNKMRASILVLGPLLGRYGEAQVALPGGCAIGARPVNLHLDALKAMGAELKLEGGYIYAKAPRGLRAVNYKLPTISVGTTVNLILAATLADGKTVLENASQEPEIIDLANCLRNMGAKIVGDGTSVVEIQGVSSLQGVTHNVLADRIEMGTYMIAPAIAGGEVEIIGGEPWLVGALTEKLKQAGVLVTQTDNGIKIKKSDDGIKPVDIRTAPFPRFPTDLQAQMMALLCLADGVSLIEETIFENRFMHVPELQRLGADISVQGARAVIRGVKGLQGAPVMATDLRASVSLILAGLCAKGLTVVSHVHHLDRGYEKLEEKLAACGAQIWRVK